MNAPIEPPRLSLGPRRIDHGFSAEQVAEFDRFVATGYLAPFAKLALEQLEHRPSFTRSRLSLGDAGSGRPEDLAVPPQRARVVHLYARTGFADAAVLRLLPGARLFGGDPSPFAVTRAQQEAARQSSVDRNYRVVDALPCEFTDGSFSHALAIHPGGNVGDRARLLAEYRRLLEPGGQIVLAVPLRGSFAELGDLLREYALKHDAPDVEAAVTGAASLRPGTDGLVVELTRAGFEQISVTTRTVSLSFSSGQALLEDPAMRLLVFPELEQNLGISLTKPLLYAQSAIDKYWSGGEPFELTIVGGCAAGYRRA